MSAVKQLYGFTKGCEAACERRDGPFEERAGPLTEREHTMNTHALAAASLTSTADSPPLSALSVSLARSE